ncbi:hypothetical protein BDV95DRAFT_41746 [Massariosphaeria phaeospora]|uniref:Rhodopsin domain-containing protein n=1 Tax=Massariosphaeria phaeospora TaxID=100035 RepID=A0A7C8M5V1_9PLEO|nr:hypothetical protein BDV95DRAFT_41746 [Massariosphaeria phaeospora]
MFAPSDLGPTVTITAFTLTSISTLVVTIRFYCRIWVVGRLKLYDYIMSAAVLCTWGLCVVNYYQLAFGTGYSGSRSLPSDTPPPPLHPDALEVILLGAARSWYAYRLLYMADLALIKLSILAFYLSIATQRTFRILVHVCIAFVVVYSTIMIFLNGFQCPGRHSLPLTAAIFKERTAPHCLHLATLDYSQAAANMFSDIFILVLPMPVLLKLRMPTSKRISLLVVFSVGLLVPIASGCYIWGVYLWATSGEKAQYYGAYPLFWSQVEVNTGIICASAPSLQPLLKRLFGELSRFRRGHSAYYYYGGDGPNAMTEAANTDTRRRAVGLNRGNDTLIDLTVPASSYQPRKHNEADVVENKFVVVRELDEEEELRNRIRTFASHRSSEYSPEPKSPARPRDILSSG